MGEPKTRAFRALLARRKRIAEQLSLRLASQQSEFERLTHLRDAAKAKADEATEAERACDGRIGEMIEGTRPIRLSDINAQRRHLETLRDVRAAHERRMRDCTEAVSRHEAEMADTRQRIVRNDCFIDLYHKRLESIEQLAGMHAEELMQEEAEETYAARAVRGQAGTTSLGSERQS